MSVNTQTFNLISEMKLKGEWPMWWMPTMELINVLNKIGSDLVGCEIGVCYGWNLVFMIENISIKQMYAIDPYNPYVDGPSGMITQSTLNEMETHFLKNTEKYNNITYLKLKSDDAHRYISDNSLDFIFIDGEHSYEQVYKDLVNYYLKVNENGIISGHDYNFDYENNKPVKRALEKFMKDFNIPFDELKFCKNDTWYIKRKMIK